MNPLILIAAAVGVGLVIASNANAAEPTKKAPPKPPTPPTPGSGLPPLPSVPGTASTTPPVLPNLPPTSLPPGFPADTSSTPVAGSTVPTTTAAPKGYTSVGDKPVTQQNTSGVSPDSKAPSPPDFQWYWLINSGDNPSRIAKTILGNEKKYPDLVLANPELPSTGDYKNPYSTGYNFKSGFTTGRLIRIPRAWNAFIALDGSRRGDSQPWTGKG